MIKDYGRNCSNLLYEWHDGHNGPAQGGPHDGRNEASNVSNTLQKSPVLVTCIVLQLTIFMFIWAGSREALKKKLNGT